MIDSNQRWSAPQRPRPWLEHYQAGVPREPKVPVMPLTRLLDSAAARHPRRPALYFLGRTITYRTLLQSVDRCAAGLRKLGVHPGDRVSLILPNCPQQVIA